MRKLVLVLAATLLVEERLAAQEPSSTQVRSSGASALVPALTVSEIQLDGLRRVSPETLRMRLESRVGEPPDTAKIEHDVRNIARLGWFGTVRADIQLASDTGATEGPVPGLRLIFYAQELPFLTAVSYTGSRLLSEQQIEKFLAEQKLKPKPGEPENPVLLNRAARALEAALAELAHPQGRVRAIRREAPNATVQVQFEIDDGPRIPLGRIRFRGDLGVTEKTLRRQLRSLAPGALFAGLRGKDAYTLAAFESDRSQMLGYLWTHGYPKAQIGAADVSEYDQASHRWWQWRADTRRKLFSIAIPIEAGAYEPRTPGQKRPESSAYTVHRLEFTGLRRFPDRFLRSRIGVREGAIFDEQALEAGLRRLARTGYFKAIQKKDVSVQPDEASRTVVVTIYVEELGPQRVSIDGGREQFGSTLGIAYSLFNILDREELLTSRIECGPEMLQLAVGLAKEGFFGSHGSLALSIFDTFLRPRFSDEVKGPFFYQHSEGSNASYQYALSNTDSLNAGYIASNSIAGYSFALSSASEGGGDTQTSSRSVALGWIRDRGAEQVAVTNSVSGGLLGGTENLLRTKLEYARLVRDPIFNRENTWALRTTVIGAGSYSGPMPFTSRFFAGDAYVRGLNDGDLGPMTIASSILPSGEVKYSAVPSGANIIGAVNAEYRWRLSSSTEAAAFMDVGQGRLLSNWLGPSRMSIFQFTNTLIRGSTGVELRWTLPAIGVPLRGYYAVNLSRPERLLPLPDGSLFRYHTRWSALGWGLGSIF